MKITLFENLRAVFYAPFYAAHARGAYRDEGLDVNVVLSPSPAHTASSLLDGTADISWGGPMRVLLTYDQNPDCDLVLFAEAVGRDPFFVIGREPQPNFDVSDLLKVKLATVSEVPTPWLCLQEDLRRAGHDPAAVNRVAEQSMAQNAAALNAGEVDAVQLFQPYAEELINAGNHLWYAAANRGPTAYTSFYATRARFEADPELMAAMTRGLARTLAWLPGADPAEVAAAIAGFFPDVAPDLLAACIARYQGLKVWNQTPVLPREGFERLKASCISGGLFSRDTPFEVCVDNRYAEAVSS